MKAHLTTILIILITFTFISCETSNSKIEKINNLPKANYTIEVEYVTGTFDTIIKTLPINSKLKIEINRGCYYLECDPFINNNIDYTYRYPFNIENAVIRYKIISIKTN